ncbi:Z1 domain-containing protein [Nocardioides jejuensis]|uniref:Putative endonuclease Z1 domain-containing protein n=1 Tax=Nocardioides jejuensis TaxID=2502782 RepID=A0A4R1CJR4_9ACTN|nr:Z1 domain-containing protein [Nocardioides jejuensis]TCJ30426.1 hypothetical protein EPD65_04300 [Nocardioides jejuensis]
MKTLLRQSVMDRIVRHRESPEVAAAAMRAIGASPSLVDEVLADIQADIAENDLLDSPTGVVDRELERAAKAGPWYTGPEDGDKHWPKLRARLMAGKMADVVPEIDRASSKVVAQLANPNIHGLSKKGLVLGYVQSGKTANFTAVMAKAADRGAGLFIVLSGIHNNLREQTQVRVAQDLSFKDGDWVSLTTADADFVNDERHSGASQLRRDRPVVIVVKKNVSRLSNLRDWLADTPDEVLRRTPVLLLDDEADQATPNSATGRQERTAINALIREIWQKVPTGTYVGYTATPFANIFMNPSDDEDLYPSNFIIDLPRPANYFGSERLFGREALSEDEEADPGLAIIREISEDDAALLRPPSAREDRVLWEASLPESLKRAVEWFIVATAVRKARGQSDHSSMLVHTTHYADPHFAVQHCLQTYVKEIADEWRAGKRTALRASYDAEIGMAAEEATRPTPDWPATEAEIGFVLRNLRVIVDNGSSADRLDYSRVDADGMPLQEIVIAVGGGTLSRGLTLEGLVVSYFTRTSSTYDTLLQMGRWFGYRPGYEDLPRLWIQPTLADEYRFLALVEAEMRQDIEDMEKQQITPSELGVRVRAHPGRLSIVARNKMGVADKVDVSFSEERVQTILFDRDAAVARRNIQAAQDFLARCRSLSAVDHEALPPRWRLRGIPAADVVTFLNAFSIHPDQAGMRADYMTGWIDNAVPDSLWNVTVIGSSRGESLGSLDLGLGNPVPAINRAPLLGSPAGIANIKALLNHADWFADFEPDVLASLSESDRRSPRAMRRLHAKGRGQILLYVVSKDSVPMGKGSTRVRGEMKADEHFVGLGVIFPEARAASGKGTYFAVKPDWQPELDPNDDEVPPDTEGDAVPAEIAAGGSN